MLSRTEMISICIAVALGTVAVLTYRDYAENERRKRALEERKALEKRMHVPRRDNWTVEELAEFDGMDPSKPILLAAKGIVWNVWRGRYLYGKDGPYQALAGKDSTRLLAKMLLEPETDEQRRQPLCSWDRMQLDDYIMTFTGKYDNVGNLAMPNLLHSAGSGLVVEVRQLVEAEIVTEVQLNQCREQDGRTALLLAADCGHTEVAQVLIQLYCNLLQKAGLNRPDHAGNTALILAAEKGHVEIVSALIKAGAALDLENSNGDTALMRAVTLAHSEAALALTSAGARTNKIDHGNKTARMK